MLLLLLAAGCADAPRPAGSAGGSGGSARAQDCARTRRTGRDMGLLLHALSAHHAARGRYPATLADAEALASALEPTFMARIPREDAWGRPLAFDVGSDDWTVTSVAEGGEPIRLSPVGLDGWDLRACGCPGDLLRPPEPIP